MITISCPNCHAEYDVDDDVAGAKVECAACHVEFIATDASTSQRPTAAKNCAEKTKLGSDAKWIALLSGIGVIAVVQIVSLCVQLTQCGTSRVCQSVGTGTGRDMAELPPGTPSELLLKYTEQGEISYVKTVMRRNPDLDINRPRDSSGRTVLYIACMNGYVDLAKLFLEHKGDTTICDAETTRYSPLTVAAKNGHVEVIKLLLSSGVDIESQDEENRTALYAAAANNKPSVVRFLCEAKAKVNCYGKGGWTPLTAAADLGYVEVVKALLQYGNGIDVEMRPQGQSHTPLYYAVRKGNPEIVEMLCKAGARVNADQGIGFSIPELAVEQNKDPKVIAILNKYR